MLGIKLSVLLTALAGTVEAIATDTDQRSVRSLLELRHEKAIVQKWDLSCGAAALATLLQFKLADAIPEREIATELMRRKEYIANPGLVTAREGFSLLDLQRFVEQRGHAGVGYGKMELEDLDKYAPIIVPVNFEGYNHFVVYRGRLASRVLLSDPAWGKRTMLVDKFLDAWITFPDFGHVGFEVQGQDESVNQNQLAPELRDFVMLH